MMGSSGPTESVAPTFCLMAKPIFWSGSDTDATIVAVKIHNAKWKELCEPEN